LVLEKDTGNSTEFAIIPQNLVVGIFHALCIGLSGEVLILPVLQHFIEFLDLLSILNQCLKLRFEILLVLYRIIYIEYLALSSHRVDSRSQEIGVPWCRKCHRMTFVSGLLFQFFKLVSILI